MLRCIRSAAWSASITAALPSGRYISRCVGRAGVDRRGRVAGILADADAEAHFAGGDAGEKFVLLGLGCAVDEGERGHYEAAGERGEGRGAAEHFGGDRCIEHAQTGAAEAFRHQQAGEA